MTDLYSEQAERIAKLYAHRQIVLVKNERKVTITPDSDHWEYHNAINGIHAEDTFSAHFHGKPLADVLAVYAARGYERAKGDGSDG